MVLTEVGSDRVGHLIDTVRIRPPSRDVREAFRDWASGLPETIGVFVVVVEPLCRRSGGQVRRRRRT